MSRYASVIELILRTGGEPEVVTLKELDELFTRQVKTAKGGLRVRNLHGDAITPGQTRVDFGENLELVEPKVKSGLVDVFGDNGKRGTAVFIEVGGEIKLRVLLESSELAEMVIRRKALED